MTADSQVPWTPEQWDLVQRLVQDTARRVSVASAILPITTGTGAPSGYAPVTRVRNQEGTLSSHDDQTLPLVSLTCLVSLTSSQLTDPGLGTAKQLFAAAAAHVAQLEDVTVFQGTSGGSQPANTLGTYSGGYLPQLPVGAILPNTPCHLRSREPLEGLVRTPMLGQLVIPIRLPRSPATVVNAIVTAIAQIEMGGGHGPYACVLSPGLFALVHTPSFGLVTGRDRILPLLGGGELLRSPALQAYDGVVLGQGGGSPDLFIGSDISAKFLRLSESGNYMFQISEKFVLRISSSGAQNGWRVIT